MQTFLAPNEHCLLIVKEIVNRLKDPENVKAIILDPENRNPDPLFHEYPWGDLSFSGGYPAILLLITELDRLFPDEKWDLVAHSYVLKIKDCIEKQGITTLSLFSGLAGICFAVSQASRGGTRYQKLLNTLNDHLIQGMERHYFIPFREDLQNGKSIAMFLYDVIQGITGIGTYGLTQLPNPTFVQVIQEILHLLVGLTGKMIVEGVQVPAWYQSLEVQIMEDDKKQYPKGNFNLGLSHGIPGVLAFLSVAGLHGITIQGQKEAMQKISDWLKDRRRYAKGSFFWESRIRFEDEIANEPQKPYVQGRDAWCYGTPGVASSLFLAGKALQDEGLKEFAVESLRSVFHRKPEEWNLTGPTFCHGISGLLLITHQIAQQTTFLDLEERVRELKGTLMQFYNPQFPFGFKNMELCKSGGYFEINNLGFLEGSVGVLLTLLTVESLTSWWHAPFLVSDGINHEK